MVNKCSSVCIGVNDLCAVQRSTFGHQPDGVKTGHNTDQVQNGRNSQRLFDNRKCDSPETLPTAGTIYFRTLIHIPGNSLQCSQNKDHLKWNSLPDCHQDYTPERRSHISKPGYRFCNHSQFHCQNINDTYICIV